jgi:hypothetical protein
MVTVHLRESHFQLALVFGSMLILSDPRGEVTRLRIRCSLRYTTPRGPASCSANEIHNRVSLPVLIRMSLRFFGSIFSETC